MFESKVYVYLIFKILIFQKYMFLFQNKLVFFEMEFVLYFVNKVVIKLIKVDKVCKVYIVEQFQIIEMNMRLLYLIE